MTIDLTSYLPWVWQPTHYTQCDCGRRLELVETWNGVQLSTQRFKPCECGVNYSLEGLMSKYGCKRIDREASR